MCNILILFTKEPVAGDVKTRLIPAIGKKGAYRLYTKLVNLMLKHFANTTYANFTIYTNTNKYSALKNFCSYFSNYPNVKMQHGNNLGDKMYHALAQELHTLKTAVETKFNEKNTNKSNNQHKNVAKVILFGADCPFLTDKIMNQVLNGLEKNDLVFVPSTDGGYMVIGARKVCPEIFQNINWSTPQVMLQTCQNLDKLGFSYQLLEPLADIDKPEDLNLLINSDLRYPL
jgi:glycosyltransferase A (GT-A) superfamily protein (DUF2064 family)